MSSKIADAEGLPPCAHPYQPGIYQVLDARARELHVPYSDPFGGVGGPGMWNPMAPVPPPSPAAEVDESKLIWSRPSDGADEDAGDNRTATTRTRSKKSRTKRSAADTSGSRRTKAKTKTKRKAKTKPGSSKKTKRATKTVRAKRR